MSSPFSRLLATSPPRHPAPVNFREKLIPLDQLAAWRAAFRASGRKLVVTNGCFDLLRELKGPARPVNNETDRALVLAALESVTAVSIFPEKRATRFLSLAQPDIYVKGGDYTLETIDQDERAAVENAGGKIVFIPFVAGKSTTGTLAKIAKL